MTYTTTKRLIGNGRIVVTRTYASGATCEIEMFWSPSMKCWVCIPE
jgi:hypothetical protein